MPFLVALALLLSHASFAETSSGNDEGSQGKRTIHEPYLEVIGLTVFCGATGVATCALLDSTEEKIFVRSWSEWGGGFSYLPTLVAKAGRGSGYHRFEEKVYWSNVTFMMDHRRGFDEETRFSASSFRLGYNFDYRKFLPAFGLGYRTVKNGRNNKAYELWLPVLQSATVPRWGEAEPSTLMMLATTWVFGDQQISPEISLQLSHRLWGKVFVTGTMGYYSDYREPDTELALGMSTIF